MKINIDKIRRFLWRKARKILHIKENTKTTINIIETFKAYSPFSAGNYREKSVLTITTINQFPELLLGIKKLNGNSEIKSIDISGLVGETASDRMRGDTKELEALFNKYGSDKATVHNYYLLYGTILPDRSKVTKVFEIGLGTNNRDIISNMGKYGRPGASLRAFRDFFPSSDVYGADIDKEVLFSEERIQTFYVNQLVSDSFSDLSAHIGRDFDLMVDDGLHSIEANIRSLSFFLPRIKVGGVAVVEDIGLDARYMWHLVAALLPASFEAQLYDAKVSLMFVVRRLS